MSLIDPPAALSFKALPINALFMKTLAFTLEFFFTA
jgi:hypothetical protein